MSLGGPSPPDPTQTANTQQAYNTTAGTASQAGSLFNQITPYGNVNYSQTGTGPGGVPLYTGTETLTPQQQSLLTLLQGNQQTAGTQAGNLLGGANYGAQSPGSVIGGQTSGATGQLMNSFNQYMQPFFTTQTQQLDTQLRNQGLSPSPSSNPSDPSTWGPYERAMNQMQTTQGQTEAGAVGTFEPLAYQQATSNYLMPLQMAMQELGVSAPSPTGINATSAPTSQLNISAPNYSQLAEQNYQQQVAQQGNLWSALSKIAAPIAGAALAPFTGGASLIPTLFSSVMGGMNTGNSGGTGGNLGGLY